MLFHGDFADGDFFSSFAWSIFEGLKGLEFWIERFFIFVIHGGNGKWVFKWVAVRLLFVTLVLVVVSVYTLDLVLGDRIGFRLVR